MSPVAQRLRRLGLVLPAPFKSPSGQPYPFVWVRVVGRRAVISGHLPLAANGSLLEPLGKVGGALTLEQGHAAARATACAVLASLDRELGSLEHVESWVRVFGMVNVAPGFTDLAAVMNGFSEVVLAVFGLERGAHARSAVGMAELPFGAAVEIEGEVLLRSR